MARQPKEVAEANRFINGISVLDFNPNVWAAFVGMSSVAVQERVLGLFMALVDHLSRKIDMDLWSSDEELELCVKAKRMQDAMRPFL